ncbi:MAG: zinc ribbon domain-containing protein [Spirochaetes bacterium]|nr:zinc ribbon domain-containing protein [Spirochaetota bacterium]
MPTYEYRCDECGDRFERFQKMSDEPVAVCPSCGGSVRRLISGGGGIIMKEASGRGPQRGTPCGNAEPCCGRGEPCGKSHGCH